MYPVTGPRRPRPETQPIAARAIKTRFVTLYGSEMEDATVAFIERLLSGSSLLPKVVDASKLTAAEAVKAVASDLDRKGHLLLCVHGVTAGIAGLENYAPANEHFSTVSDVCRSTIPTDTLIQMVVDELGIKPSRIDAGRSSLPFIYLFSCHSRAVSQQIDPDDELWRRAHLLILSSSHQTNLLSYGQAISGAIAYVDHCQRTLQEVDPLKLFFFAGFSRGDCITLMGGRLSAPLVWHAPKSEKDQCRLDTVSGSAEDLQRFHEAVSTLSATEWRLLPKPLLSEVLCNRITHDDAEGLRRLLQAHPELRDAPARFDARPLLFAAEMLAEDCVAELLAAGADPNTRDADGKTALMECVRYETWAEGCMDVLLRYGADPNLQDDAGKTALILACRERHDKAMQRLLQHGAQVNIQEVQGFSPITYAAKQGDVKALSLLLAHGADADLPCTTGATPIMVACEKGHAEAVRILLDASADLDRQGHEGETALMWACQEAHSAIVRLLLEAGAKTDLQDHQGWTALMHAARANDTASLNLLLTHGARLDLLTADGFGCLALVASDKRLDALKCLLDAGAGRSAGLNQALVDSALERRHLHAAALLQHALDQGQRPIPAGQSPRQLPESISTPSGGNSPQTPARRR